MFVTAVMLQLFAVKAVLVITDFVILSHFSHAVVLLETEQDNLFLKRGCLHFVFHLLRLQTPLTSLLNLLPFGRVVGRFGQHIFKSM